MPFKWCSYYFLLGGNFFLEKKHGQGYGDNVNLTTINFAEGEELVGLEGTLGYSYIDTLWHCKMAVMPSMVHLVQEASLALPLVQGKYSDFMDMPHQWSMLAIGV